MISTLSSGHHDAADWLLLLAVVLFALGWVVHVAGPLTVSPKLFNGLAFALAGLTSLALALFVT